MLALAVVGIGVCVAAPEMIPEGDISIIGRTASDFTLPLMDGGSFSLSEASGTPTVLAFWASWCGPCRKELPALEVFSKEHTDVTVLTVNVDRERSAAERFLKKVVFDLPVGLDHDARVMGSYGVLSMPTTVLLDANGTVKLSKIGYGAKSGFTELEAALAELK